MSVWKVELVSPGPAGRRPAQSAEAKVATISFTA